MGSPKALRRHKLHIVRHAASGVAHSFRCSSSPQKVCDFPGTPLGSAVAAATSADQGENVCNFSYGQPVCIKLFCETCSCRRRQRKPYFSLPVHGAFAKSRGHRNSPNRRNVLFLSRAFYALLLRTYVPALGFTRPFAIPPGCHPVRTYTANLRKTHLYEVVQWLPLP